MSPFDKISICEILPQREPFLFVDRLVHYDERETGTAFTVPADHLLVEDGHLAAAGILEDSRTSSRDVPRHDQIPSPVMTTLCMAFL